MNAAAPPALLADLRVIDLTDAYGAMCGRVLGDLGAEVIRIEGPDGRGHLRGPRADDGTSLHHSFRNLGKTTVALDPDRPADRRALSGLLDGADLAIVSDGWAAGRYDLQPPALAARHPRLVIVSITPFGRTGPAAGRQATELVAQCLAGVVYRSGVPELPPVAAPGSYCEDSGAVAGALAALIALHQRDREGAGQVVDVSAILALAQCTDMALPLWSLMKTDQTRSGAGLYPLFACTDGLACIVLPMAPADWRNLIRWMGDPPEWTGPEWERPMLGPDERELVMARLPEMFSSRTREEVAAEADAAGVRVTPVLTPAEVLANEHVAARESFAETVVGSMTAKAARGPYSIGDHRLSFRGPRARGKVPDWPSRPSPAGEPGPLTQDRAGPRGARPLRGLRVLEIGSGVASPEAARILGEWGAEVIKVESRRRPDFQRMVMGGEMNPAFATVARGKLGFGADLGCEPGRELVRRLLPLVDVVVENNATGVMDRLGLGWDVLHASNPRAVMVSTQLYGSRGPWSLRKGYGPSARAVGGLTWLWAHDVDAPRGVMTIHPDHLAGRLVALAALAGLRAAAATATGCHVDVAQFEAVAHLLGDLLMAESLRPGAAIPTGNRSADHAPWGLFRCADEGGLESWLAVTVTDDRAWAALVEATAGAVSDEPARRHEAGRLADSAAIEDQLAAWLRPLDARRAEERLQAAGVAAGVALHPRLEIDHPLFAGRGYPVEMEQPGCGQLIFEGPSFTGTSMGPPDPGPAPALAGHDDYICRDLLGLDAAAVRRLYETGALQAPAD